MISNHLIGFLQSASHGDQPCSIFLVYVVVHKGKATSNVTYNPKDGPEAYNNPTVHNCLSEHTTMSKEDYGPDYDPRTKDINRDVLMRVGGDKRHRRY
jgi:hypothetical protein